MAIGPSKQDTASLGMMEESYFGDRGFVHGQGQRFPARWGSLRLRPPPTVNQASEWIIVESPRGIKKSVAQQAIDVDALQELVGNLRA